MEKKEFKQEVKQEVKQAMDNKLTRADIADELIKIGIDEEGKKHNFGIIIEDDRIKIYKGDELALMDVFKGKDMTAEEYAAWAIDMIRKQFRY